METKLERQRALLSILRNRRLTSQGSVVRAMRSAGFSVTQPSISRDFQELGIVKLGGRYVSSSEMQEPEPTPENFSVLEIKAAGPNISVLTTPAGAANLVAIRIDSQQIPGVVGTIAGDDTVFVALSGKAAQVRLERIIQDSIR